MTQPDILPDDVDSAPVPYFVRDGNRYVPTGFARGGWGPSISGHVVGGLLGWAVERAVDDPGLHPARLSVDLPAPTALEPVEVHTNVRHDRRRLRLVEAVLTQRGEPVARASALFLRRGPQPDGKVWSQPVQMPPVPTELDGAAPTLFLRTYGWGGELQNPDPDWDTSGPKYTWLHETRPLIDDEPLTAFTRTAMCADVTAAIANWGTEALQFINVDYTLTLSRLPEGPHIGLAALTHYSDDGIANGSAVVVDHKGPVGSAVSVSIAHSGFRPPSGSRRPDDGRHDVTYWALIADAAQRQPNRSLLADDYGRSLSARQLHDAACATAAAFAERGIGAGTVVSWQLPTTLETVVVMAALTRLGAVQNPIIPILRRTRGRLHHRPAGNRIPCGA